MKRVIVVAYEKRTGQQYAQTLTRLFSDVADISYYCLCEGYPDHLDADIVLASTYIPFLTASMTSSLRTRSFILDTGITTPCRPVRPLLLQRSK